MKVSYNWLKELVNLDVPADKLAEEMSLYSVEVESFNPLVKASGLVIGEVLTKRPHENSDHLNVCLVNLGNSSSQIVCGAPNVAEGQKVIVALPGTKLPGGEIKVSVIRGVPSNGMICSLQELGLENKYVPAEYANGIYVMNKDAVPGEDALKYLGLDDYVIELGLTPNRMDLLSMLGVANDVNAMYALGLKNLKYDFKEDSKLAKNEIDLELKTSTCYSYYARVIENVEIKESPDFIKARLIASGIRPINNVVDITNYVLMLFGQPLHAFDKDQLGSKIIVRRAFNNEKTTTLDGIERTLNRNDIVITDNKTDDGRIVCLAGVMGGINTEVTSQTRNIVLESAVFRPLSIRRTSAKLGLRSEASVRYERGVDVNRSLEAVNYACYLLTEYASGKVLKGYVHEGIENIPDREFKITEKYVKDYLGVKINIHEINDIFNKLSFKSEIVDKEVLVKVPNRRLDITIKADLVEEIARIHGYDKLKETLPIMDVSGIYTKEQQIRKRIHQIMRGAGLNETITYSLLNKQKSQEFAILFNDNDEEISLLHPMSEERKYLRRSITNSLVDVAKYNNARKNENIAIYEIGKRYHFEGEKACEQWTVAGFLQGQQSTNLWTTSREEVDFFYVKGLMELLFSRLNMDVTYERLAKQTAQMHPERSAQIKYNDKVIGYFGALHPKYINEQDLLGGYVFEIALDEIFTKETEVTIFKSISKVPSVTRDLALIMDKNQPAGDIVQAIYRIDKKMIKEVTVFDLYQGDKIDENKKSIAVRIILESDETLTEDIISAKMKKIIKSLEYQFGVSLRA